MPDRLRIAYVWQHSPTIYLAARAYIVELQQQVYALELVEISARARLCILLNKLREKEDQVLKLSERLRELGVNPDSVM